MEVMGDDLSRRGEPATKMNPWDGGDVAQYDAALKIL